ncbi:MAG: C39 family peptidase [Ancrocorticia sp.]|jgi:GNAT superfamily N-acetyltransferase|nr:C39 family peptidase [Ancrocorticia sp.]MCI1895966.1 C39 family peptidase [Ancrocorticia sp.]MCI1933193.1 C39 family peptidase [Ancrocorticia sp.]MCI1964311.1 C39 family peptidase [Ancrocorticia sp.]MCI2029197.1 C39 family peptidase [Ancrocorticia sp.]
MLERNGKAYGFDGQDKGKRRCGLFGRIENPERYLTDRYGAHEIERVASQRLVVDMFPMSDFGGRNDCVPVAITRVFDYYRGRGYGMIPAREELYEDAVRLARRRGYTRLWGTVPVFIAGMMRTMAASYGYTHTEARGVYAWSWRRTVIPEIDAGRPLILNMVRGSYGSHTVTVIGYETFTYAVASHGPHVLASPARRTKRMVVVADGWMAAPRWIDFDALAYDVVGAGLASCNTMALAY